MFILGKLIKLFFNISIIIVFLYAILSLFTGKNGTVVESAKSYHKPKDKTLVCNDKPIATGQIYYEDQIITKKYASNSHGIWRINDSVYVQKEDTICFISDKIIL